MPKIQPIDVANFFLSAMDDDAGDLISNLKMQKLVYYAQGVHLAMFDSELFEEDIEAWEHGPVVPSLYQEFKILVEMQLNRVLQISISIYFLVSKRRC